jgi:type 1 fimbriae regulatory protein FimB/type 1 fimbriae regulatory protein FimE
MDARAEVLSFPQTSKTGKLPKRPKNKEVRTHEYLTEQEVESLMDTVKKTGRHRHRDSTLILMAYRHGLRVSELISLRWEQIDLKQGLLHVNRVKNGTASTHPISGPEIRALRKLQRQYPLNWNFRPEAVSRGRSRAVTHGC